MSENENEKTTEAINDAEAPAFADAVKKAEAEGATDKEKVEILLRELEETESKIAALQAARDRLVENIEVKSSEHLMAFKCPECGSYHFRHAGYMKAVIPFIKPEGSPTAILETHQVMVCISCKKSYLFMSDKAVDVSDKIDLDAWKRSEEELHAATGPGGEC
jgi:predicted RNA-binding Zn-ribbon protein involved in translation (DUF1610 family)